MTPEDVPEGPLVVDTDVASFLHTRRGDVDRFKPLVRDHVLCLSFASVAELWAGAEKAGHIWGPIRRDDLDRFISQHVVLPADYEVARVWARIHAVVGGQVDVNDEWIAASALAQAAALPLVTGNLKHFEPIADAFPTLVIVHPDR